MKSLSHKTRALSVLLALLLGAVAVSPSLAQQTTGTPGAPNATTTIDGRYLPPAPPKFGGEIGLGAALFLVMPDFHG